MGSIAGTFDIHKDDALHTSSFKCYRSRGESATVIGATFQWFLRDLTGMLGGVMFTFYQLLVVQEKSGAFKGTGVWKLPTGIVEEGEDISVAAIREVKEEAGIDTEFVEVLAFRQSHKSFFSKSNLMFVCMLKPKSSVIEKQDSEIEASQWMPVEEYANQPFIKKHKSFDYIAKICMAKKDNKYGGFPALSTATATSAKKSYLFSSYQEE